MEKIRIEIHLTEEEVALVDKVAGSHKWSRKKFCEEMVRQAACYGDAPLEAVSVTKALPKKNTSLVGKPRAAGEEVNVPVFDKLLANDPPKKKSIFDVMDDLRKEGKE